MNSIRKPVVVEETVRSSRFIACLFPLQTKEEVSSYLSWCKETYPGATHYVLAYRLGELSYKTDDKEPAGTAGEPLLALLTKEDLDRILLVVIRYFGGTKLGVGGLRRAYVHVVQKALRQAERVRYVKGYHATFSFSYDAKRSVDYLLNDTPLLSTLYLEQVTYEAHLTEEQVSLLAPFVTIEKQEDVLLALPIDKN